jgi:hypothetical protein
MLPLSLELQASFGPGCRGDFGDLAVGHFGQPGQHFFVMRFIELG